ncbi:MAG TPA: FtsX-like permease family protein, partial [Vicinamibacterales bacterium]|nr:FtsX-like permease family protein [Vicinamibacterales bacterium]
VVSERAARALFAERDPIGATFDDANARTLTVVGVVADIQQRVGRESEPLVYAAPGEQMRGTATTVVVLVGARHGAIAANIRRRVSALLPGTVVTVGWWTDRINALAAYRNPRFQSMVLGCFAAIALGLTALGVFGVVSVMVASRTKEIGVRLALGCLPRAVVSHAVRRSLIPILAGIAGGLLGTRPLARLAESQLYEVDTSDPFVLVLTGVIVLTAGAAAAWVPARRAGRVDPVIALRTDP